MSKIETQLEINGKTYAGKDLDLILLGMSLKEESIIKLLEETLDDELISIVTPWKTSGQCTKAEFIKYIKGEK